MLRRLALSLALSSAGPAGVLAQAAPAPRTPPDFSAGVGVQMRPDAGSLAAGARLEGAFRRVGGGATSYDLGLAYGQMLTHRSATGSRLGVKENSIDLFLRAERTLRAGRAWSFVGSAGPALAVSLGCSLGGSFAADSSPDLHGETQCANSFAKKGNVRVGGLLRFAAVYRPKRTALVLATDLAGGTIAAGNSVAAAFMIGFRAPLR